MMEFWILLQAIVWVILRFFMVDKITEKITIFLPIKSCVMMNDMIDRKTIQTWCIDLE